MSQRTTSHPTRLAAHPRACAAATVLLTLALASPVQAKQVVARLGGEQQVNVQTHGDQLDPRIASDAAGNYVVAWLSYAPELGLHLYVRLFDPQGVARSGDLQVDDPTLTNGELGAMRLAMAPDGRFVVVWSGTHAWARLFDAQGAAQGGSFRVDDVPSLPFAGVAVAMAADGRFVVAWTGQDAAGSILLRAFDATGTPLEAGRRIDTAVSGTSKSPRLAIEPGGGVVAVWIRERRPQVTQVDSQLVAVLRSGVTGSLTSEIELEAANGQSVFSLQPVAQSDGSFSIVWDCLIYPTARQPFDDHQIRARRFSSAGTPLGARANLAFPGTLDFLPSAASDRFGNTLVAIQRDGKPEARLFDSAWNPIGDPFDLATYPRDQQNTPVLASNGDGFVAAWASGFTSPFGIPLPVETQDGDGYGVFSQRFGAPLCAPGSTTLCLGPNGRFELSATWNTPAGEHGEARAHPISGDTGAFWFFEGSNLELLTKVLDGRGINDHYWYFSGALSNLDYTVKVRDTASGIEKSYHNPQGQLASRADIEAFFGAVPASLAQTVPSFEIPTPSPPISSDLSCADADPAALCLPLDHLFQVTVELTDPRTGQRGTALPLRLTDNTGAFSFFDAANLELVVKVLDGRAINQSFWFFYGGLSDVEYTITVRDLTTRSVRFYGNPRGQVESRVDTDAFRN